MGQTIYQLVQDFFHQQYGRTQSDQCHFCDMNMMFFFRIGSVVRCVQCSEKIDLIHTLNIPYTTNGIGIFAILPIFTIKIT